MTASIRERFLADHRGLEALLDQVLAAFAANEWAEASRLWTEFDSGLLSHLDAEDTYLIPELLALNGRSARVLFHEHRHIRARLVDLGSAISSHVEPSDSMVNFNAELRAHARTEDRLLYQWADAELDEMSVTPAVDALTRKPTV